MVLVIGTPLTLAFKMMIIYLVYVQGCNFDLSKFTKHFGHTHHCLLWASYVYVRLLIINYK